MSEIKECRTCGLTKSVDRFALTNSTKGNTKPRGQCRECDNAVERKRYKERAALALGIPVPPKIAKYEEVIERERIKKIMAPPIKPEATQAFYVRFEPSNTGAGGEQRLGDFRR